MSHDGVLELCIRNVRGDLLVLKDVPKHGQCSSLYGIVENLTGIPSNIQMISTGTALLDYKGQLQSYALQNGSTLYLSVKGMGGGKEDESK